MVLEFVRLRSGLRLKGVAVPGVTSDRVCAAEVSIIQIIRKPNNLPSTIDGMTERTSGSSSSWQVEPETRALRALQTAMTDAESALARRMRLGHTDMAAMTHLASAARPVGPGWLSARLGMTPAAATELVDRLEKVGHVARQRDRADRRRVNLIPTEASLVEVNAYLRPLLDALDEVAGQFSAEERAAILGFLTEVTAIYSEFAAEQS